MVLVMMPREVSRAEGRLCRGFLHSSAALAMASKLEKAKMATVAPLVIPGTPKGKKRAEQVSGAGHEAEADTLDCAQQYVDAY